ITIPMIGHSDHAPANQCCTAVYQKSVVGRKMKPRIGQSRESKMPANQSVKNQSPTRTRRGTASARMTIRQGMCVAAGAEASKALNSGVGIGFQCQYTVC